MDIRKNPRITNNVIVTGVSLETNKNNNKTKRYTTTAITNKQDGTKNSIANAVICAKNEQQKQQIIDLYNSKYSVNQVVKLDKYNDLSDNDLLHVITCNNIGDLEVATGRLFTDEPLLLLIDLTEMSSGEIARLNDLLSIPATYNGKAISNNVKLAIIIDDKMLAPGINKPSADLWRRLAKFKFYNSVRILQTGSIDYLQQANVSMTDTKLLAKQVNNLDQSSKPEDQIKINFSTANSWQEVLFGGLKLNDKGKVYFHKGQLYDITNNHIILHDAPWADPEFTSTLATVLRQGGFRANGKWVKLPENLQLSKSSTSKHEIISLFKKYVIPAEETPDLKHGVLAVINSHNFETSLSDTKMQNAVVVSSDTLDELTYDCSHILITEELTPEKWLKLLIRLSQLDEFYSPVIIDASNSSLETINKLMQHHVNDKIQTKTYQNKQDALAKFNNNDNLIYQITADTNWLEIWQTVSLTSQENFTFSQQDTELLTAIKQGKPVVFYGLETNPRVLRYFESLIIKPSYLLINGNKIHLDKANITILLPENHNFKKLPKLLQNIASQSIANSETKENYNRAFVECLLEKLRVNNIPFAQDSKTITKMFEQQLEIESELDKAKELLPVHYRKAAHSIFAKLHRDNPRVYSYIKTQVESMETDDFYQQTVDAEAIHNWLKKHPDANRKLLAQDFWLLARHCSNRCFLEIDKNVEEFHVTGVTDDEMLDKLANIILSTIPNEQRTYFAMRFGITEYDDTEEYLRCYNGSVVSTITDAMLIKRDKLKIIDPISEVAKNLAFDVYNIVQQQLSEQEKINRVYQLLAEIFPEELLKIEFHDLATNLVASQVNTQRRQLRKKQRLVARITKHPIIFLQGVAGAGKSHMAKAVVKNLKESGYNKMPEPLVLSLGPETTSSYLFGSQQLQYNNNDAHTEFIFGPILNWAMNENPPLLILDEANLVANGVLAPLDGLTNSPPQITYSGKVYFLSEKHRVILTGNPNNYDGRHMDTAINSSMLTLHYKAMADVDLAELIIKPALLTHLPVNITSEITNKVLYLYNQYNKILNFDLGPRDLQDIIARINRIIAHYGTDITLEQVYILVWESFTEILASSLNETSALQKIFDSYNSEFLITAVDNSILSKRNEKFEAFFDKLVYDNLNLDFSGKAVKQLVRDYWLFLDSQSSLQARRGLWVEGPAGWGKDSILNAVLTLWEQQQDHEPKFAHINANPNQWDKLVEAVETAMKNGQKLVISELNLLPSRYLEGLFNDLLTGKSSPGFMLFATVNPSSYSNRENLSSALMSRMTRIKLAPISYNELHKILEKRYPTNKPMINWLFSNYLDLDKLLKQKYAPIQISLANLLETAEKLQNIDPNFWLDIFQQDYGLAMMIAKNKSYSLITKTPPTITPTSIKKLQVNINSKNTKIDHKYNSSSFSRNVNFDNITQAYDLYCTQYFADNKFSPSNYRLQLVKPKVTAEKVSLEQINIDNSQVEIISVPKLPASRPIKLAQEQLLATVELELTNDNWIALPGISYADECIGISHTDLIELGRCLVTGMLVVKLKDGQSNSQQLKLDFIITPKLIDLDTAVVADETVTVTQDEYTQQLLDSKIFATNDIYLNSSLQKLHQIKNITDKKQQIKELIAWAESFKDYMDITGKGGTALIDAMVYKSGTCQHRSIAFVVLAEYFGIPARCINNSIHTFVEFSLDNQQTWIRMELGGANNPDDKVHTDSKEFLDYQYKVSNDKRSENLEEHRQFTNSTDDNQLETFTGNKQLENELDDKLNKYISIYSKKLYKLQTQPDTLIDFLNFLADKPIIINLAADDLYRRNFCDYIANTKINYSEFLPYIFNKMLANTAGNIVYMEKCLLFIYRFFAYTYIQFQQGKITSALAETIFPVCLPFLEDNLLNTGSLLGLLEHLIHDDNCRDKAEKILNKYYSNFNNSIILDDNMLKQTYVLNIDDLINSNSKITTKSNTLARFLKQVAIKTNWSYTSTGKSPNINRLALRKPAFPINKNQQETQKSIYIYLAGADYYRNHLFMQIFNDAMVAQPDKFTNITEYSSIILHGFITWLFAQMHDFRINFLIDDNTSESHFSQPVTNSSGYIAIDDSMFTTDFYGVIFYDGMQKHDFSIGDNEIIFSDLNPERIKQTFGNSAVLITQDVIAECFKEYLEINGSAHKSVSCVTIQ